MLSECFTGLPGETVTSIMRQSALGNPPLLRERYSDALRRAGSPD